MSRRLALAVVSLALAPALAAAQAGPAPPAKPAACVRETQQDTLLGGLLGAGVGALIGNAITHGGTGATIGGGLAGAAAGATVGHVTARCGQNRYGYYDEAGRWVSYRATAYGYYDPDGRWVPQPPQAWPTPVSSAADGGYRQDTRSREQALGAALQRRMDEGALPERDGRRAMRDLQRVAAIDAAYRGEDGRLTPSQRTDIEARLDELARRAALAP